jgi:hypothetical protein
VEPDAPSFPVGLVNDTDQVPPVSPVIGKGPCLDLAMASDMNVTVNGTSLMTNSRLSLLALRFTPGERWFSRTQFHLSSILQLFTHGVVKPVERILFQPGAGKRSC